MRYESANKWTLNNLVPSPFVQNILVLGFPVAIFLGMLISSILGGIGHSKYRYRLLMVLCLTSNWLSLPHIFRSSLESVEMVRRDISFTRIKLSTDFRPARWGSSDMGQDRRRSSQTFDRVSYLNCSYDGVDHNLCYFSCCIDQNPSGTNQRDRESFRDLQSSD